MGTKSDVLTGQPQHLFLQSFFDKNPGLHVLADQPANEEYRFVLADIGKKPIIPDLHKTKWQDMKKKTADKF